MTLRKPRKGRHEKQLKTKKSVWRLLRTDCNPKSSSSAVVKYDWERKKIKKGLTGHTWQIALPRSETTSKLVVTHFSSATGSYPIYCPSQLGWIEEFLESEVEKQRSRLGALSR